MKKLILLFVSVIVLVIAVFITMRYMSLGTSSSNLAAVGGNYIFDSLPDGFTAADAQNAMLGKVSIRVVNHQLMGCCALPWYDENPYHFVVEDFPLATPMQTKFATGSN